MTPEEIAAMTRYSEALEAHTQALNEQTELLRKVCSWENHATKQLEIVPLTRIFQVVRSGFYADVDSFKSAVKDFKISVGTLQSSIGNFNYVVDKFSGVSCDISVAARKVETAAGFFCSDVKKMETAVDKMGNSVKNFTYAVESMPRR
jgi:uncharacterized protein YukE